jgi:prepilin-type N-terminal cleavage/methylation domain-containing protein
MKRLGVTLIELMVATIVLGLVMSGLLQLVIGIYNAQKAVTNLPDVQWAAEDAVKRIAADLRRAPLCNVASGCTESGQIEDAALREAAADSLSVYTQPGGKYHRYAINSGALERTVSGSTPVTTTVTDATVTLALQYMKNAANGSGYYYQSSTDPDSATWVTSLPNASDLKACAAVKLTASVTRAGYTGSYSTIVRLRNSPKKQTLSD